MEHKTWIRSKVLSSRLFQIRSSSTALFIGLGIFFAQAVLWAQVPIDAATDSSGRVTQTVGRESISVTGRVIVNGVMHEDPVISRVGMQIFVDGVLAKKIMTHAEEMARKKRAEDRNFAQYVIDSSSEAAAHVACSGGSVEEIQEAWLKTFREKIEKGPGRRRPATLEVVEVDGLKISVRISREGEKPYVNECILLSPEECEHAPPWITHQWEPESFWAENRITVWKTHPDQRFFTAAG